MKTFLEKAIEYQKASSGFKFYVPSNLDAIEDTSFCELPTPNLLSGEAVIAEAHHVVFYNNLCSDGVCGIKGSLFVTNFRLFMLPYDEYPSKEPLKQHNLLLGDHGVCLTNIDIIYHVSGDKRRRLTSSSNLTDRIKNLQIVCKNFRVLSYNFEKSLYDHGKNIAKTLLHHAFPTRHALLFAYDYNEPEKGNDLISDVVEFRDRDDWTSALSRMGVSKSKWRVSTQINDLYEFASTLPRLFVVPSDITEYDLATMSGSFRSNRPPCWTFSTSDGAVLVRMADLLPTVTERTQENRILEYIRKTHPALAAPIIKDLTKELPSIQDIYLSYLKLRDLFTPETDRRFKSQDARYYLLLEQTKWLNYVSLCLKCAKEMATNLLNKFSVVLQELDGKDTSAVVSSLVQIMLDKECRTISGFQSLIQKEWVALGHPFCSRLGHIQKDDSQQAPIFLLFLDCVWQLLRQFPTSFQFSETYLTTLFDSCYLSVFDTFLFDCERERKNAVEKDQLKRRSVWNWSKQFSLDDQIFFYNPLYNLSSICKKLSNFTPKLSIQLEKIVKEDPKYLKPRAEIPNLELWSQCYFRWVPLLVVKGGGYPQVDLEHRRLRHFVESLILKLGCAEDFEIAPDDFSFSGQGQLISQIVQKREEVDSNFPFTSTSFSTSNLLANTTLSEFDSQSLLNISE